MLYCGSFFFPNALYSSFLNNFLTFTTFVVRISLFFSPSLFVVHFFNGFFSSTFDERKFLRGVLRISQVQRRINRLITLYFLMFLVHLLHFINIFSYLIRTCVPNTYRPLQRAKFPSSNQYTGRRVRIQGLVGGLQFYEFHSRFYYTFVQTFALSSYSINYLFPYFIVQPSERYFPLAQSLKNVSIFLYKFTSYGFRLATSIVVFSF